jgi:hypothetical protein
MVANTVARRRRTVNQADAIEHIDRADAAPEARDRPGQLPRLPAGSGRYSGRPLSETPTLFLDTLLDEEFSADLLGAIADELRDRMLTGRRRGGI